MAKRKRLTPPNPEYLDEAPLETKTMFPLGVARTGVAPKPAPIADVARDTSAVAALEDMAETWRAAREEGRLVLDLAHDDIRLDHLHRDRIALDPDEMAALKDSLKTRGQQTPVEVVALTDGAGYGLLSGWRRCQALRALYQETGDAQFATVQALLRQPRDAAVAYRTMVEENEIRANLSHYERARIVVTAVKADVFENEEKALSGLFGSVPRARRSKIRSFLRVVQVLDGVLQYPEALNERLGLELSQRLRDEPTLAARLEQALTPAADSPAMEQSVIAKIMRAELGAPVNEKSLNKPSEAQSGPKSELVAQLPDIVVRRTRGGDLVLQGPGVDAALGSALVEWLSRHLKG